MLKTVLHVLGIRSIVWRLTYKSICNEDVRRYLRLKLTKEDHLMISALLNVDKSGKRQLKRKDIILNDRTKVETDALMIFSLSQKQLLFISFYDPLKERFFLDMTSSIVPFFDITGGN